jgi:hypothetical protein
MELVNSGTFINLDKVETGDILIYNSINNTSFGISFLTKSIYTHVGIAIWADVNINVNIDEQINIHKENINTKKLLILETDLGDGKFDYIRLKNIKNNVRLISIDENLRNVNKIYVRKLKINRDQDFYDKFYQFIYDYKDIPYEKDNITIFSIMLGINKRKNNDKLKSAICTEVVYEYLSEMSNLKFNKVYYPKYYAKEYSDKDLNLILGEQYKIYDADFGTYFIAFLVLILFLIIISIFFRTFSMYKYYNN